MLSRRYVSPIILVLVLGLMSCAREPITLVADYPIVVSQEGITSGRSLYMAHCLICHANPEGGGRNRYNAPLHSEEGHTWHHGDRDLVDWVLNGLPERGVMPAFGTQLSEDDVIDIIAYIKSTWGPRIRDLQNATSQAQEGRSSR